MSQERTGLLCAALCALTGAFVPAVAKLTTNTGDPLAVALATTLFGALAASISLWWHGRLRNLLHPQHTRNLILIGFLGTSVAFTLFFTGARMTSAIDTVLCLQAEPAYSLLLAWIVLGHRPTLRRILAIAVLLAGITLAVGGRSFSGSAGIGFLLLTPLCWQISHLIVLRRLAGVSPEILTAARYIYGGFLLLIFWLAGEGTAAASTARSLVPTLPLLAVQGMVLSYAGTLFWYGAVTRLDLARATAIVVPSVPLLSIGASFLLLGEIPSLLQWMGIGLTAVGVATFVTAPHVSDERLPGDKVAASPG